MPTKEEEEYKRMGVKLREERKEEEEEWEGVGRNLCVLRAWMEE